MKLPEWLAEDDSARSIGIKSGLQAAGIVFAVVFFSVGLKMYGFGEGPCRVCESFWGPFARLMRSAGILLLAIPVTWSIISMSRDSLPEEKELLRKCLPISGFALIALFSILAYNSFMFFLRSISCHSHLGG